MEFRDALRTLRKELGLTQLELANALHINVMTVSRWELGKSYPNPSVVSLLLGYAYTHSVSRDRIDAIKQAITEAAKKKVRRNKATGLAAAEHSTLVQLIDDAAFPIYVCDIITDQMLYANKKALQIIGLSAEKVVAFKCYECIMHRDSACDFCHKNQLLKDAFSSFDVLSPVDSTVYSMQGRLISWNGHEAQVRYVLDYGHTANVEVLEQRRLQYKQQLAARKKGLSACEASAHYNLTENTVSIISAKKQDWAEIMSAGTVDAVLKAIRGNTGTDEERRFDLIRDRNALINLYYTGKSRITVVHHLKDESGLYESIFDLFQNPVTFAIEAYATLRAIPEKEEMLLPD